MVASDIELKLPLSSERTDDEIAASAVRALEQDTLLGSWAERDRAERVAWIAPGIPQVEHRIQVSYT